MKYKVGDIVTVRSDLEVHERYGCEFFAPRMVKFKGKKVTIDRIAYCNYEIEEDGREFYWTDEMFEKVEE